MSTHDETDFAFALHELARFIYESGADKLKIYPYTIYIPVYDYEDDPAKPKMQEWARLLAPCEKVYTEDDFELKRNFGPHSITVYTRRANVCTKRVVGTKRVEKTTYTAEDQLIRDNMNTVTVFVDEEIVEWECDPLLGS
jgi:hypothetical protein